MLPNCSTWNNLFFAEKFCDCFRFRISYYSRKAFEARLPDVFDTFEMLHQRFPGHFADSFYRIKLRGNHTLAAFLLMKRNCKSVHFVLDI